MTPIEMRLFGVFGILVTAVLVVTVVHLTFAAVRAVRTWTAWIHARRVDGAPPVPQRSAARRLPC